MVNLCKGNKKIKKPLLCLSFFDKSFRMHQLILTEAHAHLWEPKITVNPAKLVLGGPHGIVSCLGMR